VLVNNHGIFHGILLMQPDNQLKINIFFWQTTIEWE